MAVFSLCSAYQPSHGLHDVQLRRSDHSMPISIQHTSFDAESVNDCLHTNSSLDYQMRPGRDIILRSFRPEAEVRVVLEQSFQLCANLKDDWLQDVLQPCDKATTGLTDEHASPMAVAPA